MATKKKKEAVFCSAEELEGRKTSVNLTKLVTEVIEKLYTVSESYEVDGFTTFIQGAIEILVIHGVKKSDIKRKVKKFIHTRWLNKTSPPGYPPDLGIIQKALHDLQSPDVKAEIVNDVRLDGTTKTAVELMEEIFTEILSKYTPVASPPHICCKSK